MQGQDFANKHIPVVLGTSVQRGAQDLAEIAHQGCVTMRYDFKPVSVDYSHGSVVKSEAGEARLVHEYKQEQDSDAVFRGTASAGAASDYVLVYDGEKFVVERLVEYVGALKHLRSADVAGHDNSVAKKRTRNPRAAIVAAAKKQKKKETAAAAAAAAAAVAATSAVSSAESQSSAPPSSVSLAHTTQDAQSIANAEGS